MGEVLLTQQTNLEFSCEKDLRLVMACSSYSWEAPTPSVHTYYIWFIRLEEQLVVIRGTVGIHRNADCLYKNTFTTQNTYIVNQKLEH
jgi:hypothetical protein